MESPWIQPGVRDGDMTTGQECHLCLVRFLQGERSGIVAVVRAVVAPAVADVAVVHFVFERKQLKGKTSLDITISFKT